MKRRIYAALLVVLVSAFSFASGTAQTAPTGTSSALMTDYQVTTVGSTNWASSLTAPAGTTVSWLLSYHNMGTTNVGKLIISSSLVSNQTLVPGSVMWFDGNFPNGYKLSDTGLFDAGVDVGGVAAGTNGFIRYRTQSVETTPCGITSESAGYFDADGAKSSYKAIYATPACIETATAPVTPTTSPTTTITDVTEPTATTHDHTVATTTTPTVTTSAIPQTSATPLVATGGTVTTATTPVVATTTSSTTGTVHEAHALTTVSSTTTEAASPATPAATSTPSSQATIATVDTSHADHSTTTTQSATSVVVAQATPTVTTTTADTSTHASHTVAATPTPATSTTQVAGASTETTAHTDHTTTTPAPGAATNQSTEHSGHTIPAAGGNPIWLMSGALALGYIGKLLLLKRKMRNQPVMMYWQ